MKVVSNLALAGVACVCSADVVVFENTNPAFEDMAYTIYFPKAKFTSVGQQLDITADAFSQPAEGIEIDSGVWFFYQEGNTSSFDWSEVHASAMAAIARVPSSEIPQDVPEPFADGSSVGAANDWTSTTHAFVRDTSGPLGDYYPNDTVFTAGILIEIDGQTHYGFVTLERTNGLLRPTWKPLRWGYETEANVPAVVPSSCPADVAEPFGTLNIFDLQSYIGMYNAQDPSADLAAPFGVWNIFDVQAYINLYNAGCP